VTGSSSAICEATGQSGKTFALNATSESSTTKLNTGTKNTAFLTRSGFIEKIELHKIYKEGWEDFYKKQTTPFIERTIIKLCGWFNRICNE